MKMSHSILVTAINLIAKSDFIYTDGMALNAGKMSTLMLQITFVKKV